MKRFRFRLQTLLDMKQRREEELARKVAEKNGEIVQAQKNLQDGRDRLARFQAEEKLQRTSAPSAVLLRVSVAHCHALQRDIEEANRRIAGLRRELESAVHSLTEAKKETRALEILRDNKRDRWKRDFLREEQQFTDDVSQKGQIRKSLAAVRAGPR
jgi:flagellar protein FliJ